MSHPSWHPRRLAPEPDVGRMGASARRDPPVATDASENRSERHGQRLQPGSRGSHRLRDRDRRTGQGRRRAALSRRGHRGPRRPRHLRQRVGAAGRRQVRPGPAARRAVPDPGAHRRRPRRRPGRARDARPGVGLPAAARHQRRGGPRAARPRRRHGAVLRGAVRARAVHPGRPAGAHRPVRHDHRAVHDPLARRAGSRARQGDRRLLRLGGRARDERLHVHRARHRLDRRRRRRGHVRRHRRHERPAARRRARPRAADDRRGREDRRRRQGRAAASSTAASG